MGSLGTGELLVIAIVALVVFGPKRLPELARKAGELLEKARSATRTISDSLDGDYGELAAPLQTLKSEYDATVEEIKNVGSTVAGMGATLPGEEVEEEVDGREEDVDGSLSTGDSTEEEGAGDSDTVDRLPSTDDPLADDLDPDSGSAS